MKGAQQLGPLLNGIINNEVFLPSPAFTFRGTASGVTRSPIKMPPNILGVSPISLAARTMPTKSGG